MVTQFSLYFPLTTVQSNNHHLLSEQEARRNGSKTNDVCIDHILRVEHGLSVLNRSDDPSPPPPAAPPHRAASLVKSGWLATAARNILYKRLSSPATPRRVAENTGTIIGTNVTPGTNLHHSFPASALYDSPNPYM